MSATYKMITLIGTSTSSYEDAIQSAVTQASTTVRNLAWFEVQEMRGRIQGDRVAEYQVKIQVGFRVE
jgi:hypothetical protein